MQGSHGERIMAKVPFQKEAGKKRGTHGEKAAERHMERA
jgi:hypothetical protein